MNQRTIILLLIGIFLIYYLFPAQYHITVLDELGNPLQADYLTSWNQGGFGNEFNIWLTPGDHTLTLSKTGFDTNPVTVHNWNNFQKREDLTFTLKATRLSQSDWDFTDPTRTLTLHPAFRIKGTDVLGNPIDQTIRPSEEFLAGYYDTIIEDVHFQKKAFLDADHLQLDSAEPGPIVLVPNERMTNITPQEAQQAFNFVIDYINLSQLGLINEGQTLPQQYYVTSQQQPLSTGDLVFLYCLHAVYEYKKETNRIYFAPNTKLYTTDKGVTDPLDCYRIALQGYLPEAVTPFTQSFSLKNIEINSRKKLQPIVFTFDIESGRYVHAEGAKGATNPCTDNITGMALSDEQKRDCSDPNQVGWFTKLRGENNESIPYPWVTGVQGTKEIQSYSAKYGIPATHFMVTSEVKVLNKYDPSIMNVYDALDGSLIEIGSHTHTHSKLGTRPRDEDEQILSSSRTLLQTMFNVPVDGFRAPYLSRVGNSIRTHQLALQQAGYQYHSSDYGEDDSIPIRNYPINVYYTADTNLVDLPYRAQTDGYILTLDHPWNMQYSESIAPGQVYLYRNDSRAALSKAFIFGAIAEGYQPMTLHQLNDLMTSSS